MGPNHSAFDMSQCAESDKLSWGMQTVKRREPEVLSCTLSCETAPPLIRHPLFLSLPWSFHREREPWGMEREKDRERFHLIDKEFCLQVVLNLASQPLTPMWTGNALAGTLKSRRSGQGTGVTSKQLNFSKRPQIMLRYSGSAKKRGKGLQDIKQQILKSLLNLWSTTKKKIYWKC